VVLGVSKDIAAFIQDEVAIAVGRSIFTSAGLIVVNFCLIVFLPGFGPQLAGLLFLPGLYFITRAILGSRKVFRLLEENPSFEAGPWARRGAVKALVIGLAPVPFLGGAVAISMALGDAIPAAIIVLAVSFGLSAVVFFFVLPSSSRGHSAS
jgi:hypothetical protein